MVLMLQDGFTEKKKSHLCVNVVITLQKKECILSTCLKFRLNAKSVIYNELKETASFKYVQRKCLLVVFFFLMTPEKFSLAFDLSTTGFHLEFSQSDTSFPSSCQEISALLTPWKHRFSFSIRSEKSFLLSCRSCYPDISRVT